MTLRIGLMGLGRIGRNVFRLLHERDDVEIAAISDIADPKGLEYLIRYDTILGRFPGKVTLEDGHLHVRGKKIKMLNGREPGDVDWGALGVDVVVEATGKFRSRAEMSKHLDKGAKRVVLCVPATDEPDATIVMGVNHDRLEAKHRIISNASITAHCAAPIIKILEKTFGIERLFFTTVHAYTNDQRLADVPADDLRRSRAAAENIIPTDTNSTRTLIQIMPQLEGKISGMALKVPVLNGSLVDMVTFTKKPLSVAAVNDAVRTAVEAEYKTIVEYTTDPIVSSDVVHSAYSSTYDSLATMAMGENAVKTIAWYDNGWGYAHRLIELVKHLASLPGGL